MQAVFPSSRLPFILELQAQFYVSLPYMTDLDRSGPERLAYTRCPWHPMPGSFSCLIPLIMFVSPVSCMYVPVWCLGVEVAP